MTTRADRATGAQLHLLENVLKSHVFTEGERRAAKAEMYGAVPLSKNRASALLYRALKVVKERKAKEAEGEPCWNPDCSEPATHEALVEYDQETAGYATQAVLAKRWCCPACADAFGVE